MHHGCTTTQRTSLHACQITGARRRIGCDMKQASLDQPKELPTKRKSTSIPRRLPDLQRTTVFPQPHPPSVPFILRRDTLVLTGQLTR
ncbi:hypothetical protein VTJ04DRAFT_8552 [Mycothermus thermophilus]|uniref:uncharacterized protein n=1 Tax=Humicola insolens TaxID=85995 RepID=UPI003742D7DD